MKRSIVSPEDIVAVAEQSADRTTERRVMVAALHDPGVRQQLDFLRRVEREPLPVAELTPRARARLEEKAAALGLRFGQEYGSATATKSAEGITLWWQRVTGSVLRALEGQPRPLGLTSLAPALAASSSGLEIEREVFTLEKLRVELHQGTGERQLRFLVDASETEEFQRLGATEVVVALALDDNPELLVSVLLNANGRGMLSWTAPVVQGPVRLRGVALVKR